uniref:Centromere protein P n=1 Tax=Xenopus tropicalis TaxID=8364 RepID=A0A803K451_XENTR
MQNELNHPYEDEIALLQEEIQELTRQYKEVQTEAAFLSSANFKQALQSYHGIHIPDQERMKDTACLMAQIEDCKNELQFLNNLSGLEFTKYLKKTEHKSDNQAIYKHRLVGQCQSLLFQLEFQTLESKSRDNASQSVIDLNIIMECREQSDLSKFVSRVEERRNLLLFFRSLSSFAEWCECRKNTFAKFKCTPVALTCTEGLGAELLKSGLPCENWNSWKEKYPLAVGLPAGASAEYMTLRNPQNPGCELLILWRIHIDDEGSVIPILDLLPKIPEQAVALDKSGVVEGAASGFRNLLRVFGIHGSIERLIQSFCCLSDTDASV